MQHIEFMVDNYIRFRNKRRGKSRVMKEKGALRKLQKWKAISFETNKALNKGVVGLFMVNSLSD